MRSFVKPSFAAKFGLASATSAAMAVTSMVAMPASAATISITTCDADGSGLLSAVATAESTPTADVIEINISSDCTMTLNSSIDISTSITIDNIHATSNVILKRTGGSGHVIDVNGMTSPIAVVLEGLTISGVADAVETARLIDFDGNATHPSSFTIRDTTVTGGEEGGVNIDDYVDLTVEDSFFSYNLNQDSERDGGAIRASDGSDITISNTNFSNNGYTMYLSGAIGSRTLGGAVYIEEGNLSIAGSTFSDNRSAWGGAIYAKDANVTFTGATASTFTGNGHSYYDLDNNLLDGHAGAIDVHGDSTFIANSPLTFDGNISRGGGAIQFKIEADTTVEFNADVTFTDNYAQNDGGAIKFYSSTENYLDDVQVNVEFNGSLTYFAGNRAGGFFSSYYSDANGGAIAVEEDNYYSPYSGDQQLFTFEFNSAQTTFFDNYAEDDGGAIYVDMHEGFSVLDFVDEDTPGGVTFDSNVARDDGSAIYLETGDDVDDSYRGQLFLDGATFVSNYSNSDGTIYLEDSVAYVSNSLFSDNYVEEDGGIFYLEDDDQPSMVVSYYNKFFDNVTDDDGGIFYLEDESSVTSISSLFHYNYSAGVGSIITMQQNTTDSNYIYFVQNTFYLNYSQSDSAAFRLGQATEGVVAFNTFAYNTSSGGDLALSIEHNSAYAEALNLFGNIFATMDDTPVISTGNSDNVVDLGFNLLTGPSGQSLNGGTSVDDYSLALRDGRSLIVTWEQLDLQGLQLNDDNPSNSGALSTIALGANSVAVDFLPTSVVGWSDAAPVNDMRGVTRHVSGSVEYGNGIDAGAFESIYTFVPQDEEPEGTSPNVVITHVSKPAIQAAGDTIVIYGRGLNDVTELFFNGTKVTFVKQADGTLLVTTPAMPLGEVLITANASDGTAVLQHAFWVVDSLEFSTWTKDVGDTIKIYAKNLIGVGKVQFFVDGKEIAWINAVDATDPKLRTSNGFHYLVRTVQLKADGSKTRFEVKLNGERVRRNTYTINSN